jgi:hypothetical protein
MPRLRLKSFHYLLFLPYSLILEIRYYTLSHNFAQHESFKMQKTLVAPRLVVLSITTQNDDCICHIAVRRHCHLALCL